MVKCDWRDSSLDALESGRPRAATPAGFPGMDLAAGWAALAMAPCVTSHDPRNESETIVEAGEVAERMGKYPSTKTRETPLSQTGMVIVC